MKVNRPVLPQRRPPSRGWPRGVLGLGGVAFMALLGSCAGPAVSPVAPPRPAPPVIRPPESAPVPPPPANWRDAPVVIGLWHWSGPDSLGISQAGFLSPDAGDPWIFRLACYRGLHRVGLEWRGGGGRDGVGQRHAARISTTSAIRTADAREDGVGSISLALDARDPLLDAIAYSRGRFMVEVDGQPPLILPNRPEVARVIEDCRER